MATPKLRLVDPGSEATFFRAAITASPTPLMVLERRAQAWVVVYVNPAFERHLGRAGSQVLECDWRVLCAQPTASGPALVQAAIDHGHEMRALVRTARRRGRDTWTELHVSPVPGVAPARRVMQLRDVTQEKAQREQLEHHALHDALTGLPNRKQFHERLDRAIDRGRMRNGNFALALLDLDGFKQINDTRGHATGDEVLKVIAERLSHVLRASDCVARLGGDEFALLIESVTDRGRVADIVRHLASLIATPVLVANTPLQVGCSVGIGWYPLDATDAQHLLAHADAAMYAHKHRRNSRALHASAAPPV